jgi:U3 small nucleolar RNA-associated protein 12
VQSAVTALAFNASGTLLASGGRDTEVVVWDIVQEAGLMRLKGHKDAVTDVRFLERSRRLLSSSKDTLVKLWDLDTQHCIHTFVGHRCARCGCFLLSVFWPNGR